MGAATSSRFEVHARTRASNQYTAAAVVALHDGARLEDALGVFKREVYAFALRRDYGGGGGGDDDDTDPKCLYLYLGWWRLARAEVAPDRAWLRLRFRSPALRDAWFAAEERLGREPPRWPQWGGGGGGGGGAPPPAVAPVWASVRGGLHGGGTHRGGRHVLRAQWTMMILMMATFNIKQTPHQISTCSDPAGCRRAWPVPRRRRRAR
jgi:hypothetical protein